MFKYVSAFCGVGGFETALNKFGGECVFAVDNDNFVAKGYETLYGHLYQSDIQAVPAYIIPDHSLMVASFPNEPYSVMGKSKGLSDKRSASFDAIPQIAKEKNPRVILLENVKGLLSQDGGNVFIQLMKKLTDVGYRIDFNIINALDTGLPQNRSRLFIVAVREDIIEKQLPTFNGQSPLVKRVKLLAHKHGVKLFNLDWLSVVKDIDNNDEIPNILSYLDEAVDKKRFAKKEVVHKFLSSTHKSEKKLNKRDLRFVGGIRQSTYWGNTTEITSSKFGIGNRVYDARGIATFIPSASVGGHGGHSSLYLIPIAKPKETSATKLEKETILVDGVKSTVWIPKVRKEGKDLWKVKYTETSNDYVLRALTPSECFALQGFSKDTYKKLEKSGLSMTQLYKQAGNATNVAMVESIFSLIKPYL